MSENVELELLEVVLHDPLDPEQEVIFDGPFLKSETDKVAGLLEKHRQPVPKSKRRMKDPAWVAYCRPWSGPQYLRRWHRGNVQDGLTREVRRAIGFAENLTRSELATMLRELAAQVEAGTIEPAAAPGPDARILERQ